MKKDFERKNNKTIFFNVPVGIVSTYLIGAVHLTLIIKGTCGLCVKTFGSTLINTGVIKSIFASCCCSCCCR